MDCPLPGEMGNDPANIADETHVEHAVGFVDDESRRRAEHDMLLPYEIEEPSGRSHENVDALAHHCDLPVSLTPPRITA